MEMCGSLLKLSRNVLKLSFTEQQVCGEEEDEQIST